MIHEQTGQGRILVVDDEPDIRALLKDILEDEGYQVSVAPDANQADELKLRETPELILLDIWMPEMDGVSLLKQWNDKQQLNCPVVMMSGHGTVETAVEATRYGAFDFVEKPLSMAKLLRTVKTALDSNKSAANSGGQRVEEPVGNSRIMQQLRQTMQELATQRGVVFFSGSPGSGASLWAGYLFSLQRPPLPQQSFHPDTSYYQHGLDHNVFIPEVTELDRRAQQVLLKLLQEARLSTGLGQFVIASQYDFDTLRHRSDIIPELAEFWRSAIQVPTLNQRIEDIPELLEYYVNRFADQEGLPYRHFGVAAQNMIRNHDWHGGLTELKSLIHRLLMNDDSADVELHEIQGALQTGRTPPYIEDTDDTLLLKIDLGLNIREAREQFEREYLQRQLEICHHNVSELARKIGLERTNLYRKLKSLGIQAKK
jgi:DNA-binding NtrC family response regulator